MRVMGIPQEYIDKVVCGDALDFLRGFPDNSVDLVITSPPYYNQRDYTGLGIGNEARVEEYIENLMRIFVECVRVTKKTGSLVYNIGDKYENGNLLLVPYRFAIEAMRNHEVRLVNEITWVKMNPVPKQDKRKLVPSHEPFFLFVKSNDYYFNKDAFLSHIDAMRGKVYKNGNNIGKRYFNLIENSDLTEEQKELAGIKLHEVIEEVKQGKIESFRMKIRGLHAMPYGGQDGGRKIHIERDGFTIIRIHGKSIKKDIIESPVETIKWNIHPAIYPEYLIQEFLKLLTKEGDFVLDPFMGSGTTGVVARKLGRHYIGIEISPEYCEYANKRISKVRREKNLDLFL